MNIPEEIRLNPEHNALTLRYTDAEYTLSAEYLRVHSPSAQVRGHGKGQEILQTGKRAVTIVNLDIIGNYALKITFSDQHDSGLYDWDYLHRLGAEHDENWQTYLNKLTAAGADRDTDQSLTAKKSTGCGHTH